MNPRVSIVVPVYNVKKYLEMCIQSILEQSFQNYEIILVDDGSTDGSGELCDFFNAKHTKIHVIHQQNAGLSHARNVGTEKSIGDYITYIDSDDTIHKDYLKVLISLIEKYQADVSSCEFDFVKEGDLPDFKDVDYVTGVRSGMEAFKLMLSGGMHGTSSCGLLIKNNLAKAIVFPVGKYHEDDLTTYKYFINAEKVAYTKQPLYIYYQHNGSIMHKPFGIIDIDELDAGDHLYDVGKKFGREYEKVAFAKKAYNYFQVLFKFPDLKIINLDAYNRIISFIKSNKWMILKNNYINRNIKIKIILYRMGLYSVIRNRTN